MTETRPKLEAFGRILTEHQSRLYAFVFTLVADPQLAHDVFQETNRVLWEHAGDFDLERPFLPWAFAVARNQVRRAWQKRGRDRLAFDDDVVQRICDHTIERHSEQHCERQVALAECIEKLPPKQQDLVTQRYLQSETLQSIAGRLGRTTESLAVTLHRVRRTLAECIDGALRNGAEA